uniref:Uncharacterized protein n=1 Tax=Pararge aegeria TaxID=116150 RepID=S4NXG3_9NEOP
MRHVISFRDSTAFYTSKPKNILNSVMYLFLCSFLMFPSPYWLTCLPLCNYVYLICSFITLSCLHLSMVCNVLTLVQNKLKYH